MKKRDLVKQLIAAGFELARQGDHEIYKKPGCPPIPVPRHAEIDEYTARNILKAAGLK